MGPTRIEGKVFSLYFASIPFEISSHCRLWQLLAVAPVWHRRLRHQWRTIQGIDCDTEWSRLSEHMINLERGQSCCDVWQELRQLVPG